MPIPYIIYHSFEFTAIKDSGRAHPSGTNSDWSRPKYRNHNKSLTIWSHYLPTEICALCYLHKDQGHNVECSYAIIFFFLCLFFFFSHRLVTWLGYVAIHLSCLSFILWILIRLKATKCSRGEGHIRFLKILRVKIIQITFYILTDTWWFWRKRAGLALEFRVETWRAADRRPQSQLNYLVDGLFTHTPQHLVGIWLGDRSHSFSDRYCFHERALRRHTVVADQPTPVFRLLGPLMF
jgi:hypothetical protein